MLTPSRSTTDNIRRNPQSPNTMRIEDGLHCRHELADVSPARQPRHKDSKERNKLRTRTQKALRQGPNTADDSTLRQMAEISAKDLEGQALRKTKTRRRTNKKPKTKRNHNRTIPKKKKTDRYTAHSKKTKTRIQTHETEKNDYSTTNTQKDGDTQTDVRVEPGQSTRDAVALQLDKSLESRVVSRTAIIRRSYRKRNGARKLSPPKNQ